MDVILAIPVFNEQDYVDDILKAVQKYMGSILVIDDGSTDNTPAILSQYHDIHILQHKTNQGYGQCLIDAFHFAFEHHFDWIITLDCDHQHEPTYIPHFFKEATKENLDIISGSRYLIASEAGLHRVPPQRRRINHIITQYLNQSLGLNLTDAFCGFKAYRVDQIIKLSLSVKGYGLPLQLWVQAAYHRLRIMEIAVPLIYHNPERQFHGDLEDPDTRLNYYMTILRSEIKPYVHLDRTHTIKTQFQKASVLSRCSNLAADSTT